MDIPKLSCLVNALFISRILLRLGKLLCINVGTLPAFGTNEVVRWRGVLGPATVFSFRMTPSLRLFGVGAGVLYTGKLEEATTGGSEESESFSESSYRRFFELDRMLSRRIAQSLR